MTKAQQDLERVCEENGLDIPASPDFVMLGTEEVRINGNIRPYKFYLERKSRAVLVRDSNDILVTSGIVCSSPIQPESYSVVLLQNPAFKNSFARLYRRNRLGEIFGA